MVDPSLNHISSLNSSRQSFSKDVCIELPSPGVCCIFLTPCPVNWYLGPCTTSSIQRWHYEAASGTCRQFTFGGCGGNGNNFVTLHDCEAACDGVTEEDVTRLCSQRPEAGPCRGQITRFFFDPASDSCQEFLYGGCAGNRNNFISLDDCSSVCSDKVRTRRKNKPKTRVKTCSLLSDHGPCSNDQMRLHGAHYFKL